MITYYLRFTDEAEATTALDAEGWRANGKTEPATGFRWDILRTIVITPPVTDLDGNEVTPAVIDDRYHVNVYALNDDACPDGLAPYQILAPASPARRFGVG